MLRRRRRRRCALGIAVRQAERLDEPASIERGHDRRRRLRRADPVEPARPRELAERAPVAAPALARSGADRARDHGRGRGERGVRDPPRGGARRRADRRLARPPRSAATRPPGTCTPRLPASRPELIDEALANDSFSPQVGEPTYAEKIGPADRELDWSRPAKELHDRIRALSPHIGARGEVEGRQVIVWRARLDGDRLRACSRCSRKAGPACPTTPGSAAYAPDHGLDRLGARRSRSSRRSTPPTSRGSASSSRRC